MSEQPKRIGRDCQWSDCTKTVSDGPLWRVNPKGERGIFMCGEHARALSDDTTGETGGHA